MDTPENYYAVLGVSADADSDTIKRAYRQLARRFHPDLAGPEAALQMKRINRAYAILSDEEKRHQYNIVLGGVVDMRQRGYTRPQPRAHARENPEDVEFSSFNIFCTKGPFHAGPSVMATHGVTSALNSVLTTHGILIAAGSLDGKGCIWQIVNGGLKKTIDFANDSEITLEAFRELRFSSAGSLLAGWNRLGLHVWDGFSGKRLWSTPLNERAVSAHYSLDASPHITADGRRIARLALPHLPEAVNNVPSPRAWGVRSTDVLSHDMSTPVAKFTNLRICQEEAVENRNFWAIRMRALSQDASTLVTLSCAQIQGESQQMAVIRRWQLASKGLLGGMKGPHIATSILMGRCEDCTPPYATTPDASFLAFSYANNKIRLADTINGTYSEVISGPVGSSSRMAISPDGQWLALAREDSEVNEGVIDLWSVVSGQVVQKFYHPWQVSALHFNEQQLITALTDGTIQVWQASHT